MSTQKISKPRRSATLLTGGLKSVLPFAAIGLLSGFLNGLLGAGGGIPLVIAFGRLLPRGTANGAYANAPAVMLVISCATLTGYLRSGQINTAGPVGLPPSVWLGAALGGLLGALLLSRLRSGVLKAVFGGITLLSGIMMLTR